MRPRDKNRKTGLAYYTGYDVTLHRDIKLFDNGHGPLLNSQKNKHVHNVLRCDTRSQVVARIADRIAS